MTSLELSKKQLDKPKEKGEVYLENEACKSKMSSSQREENCKRQLILSKAITRWHLWVDWHRDS